MLLWIASFVLGAEAQPAGDAAALPNLPAIQYETAAGAAPTTATAPAQAGEPSAMPAAGRFTSVGEARDKMREAFAARNYSAVLGLADEIRQQFPGETFMRYYEATARMQLKSSGVDPSARPYQQLDSLPTSRPVGPKGTATPAATPAPTPNPTAQATPPPTPEPASALPVMPMTPPKTGMAKLADQLAEMKIYLFGGGGLLVIVALTVMMLRRGKRAEEEGDEEQGDLFGEQPLIPERANGSGNGEYAIADAEDERPHHPARRTSVFRSAAQSSVFARPEVELEIVDEIDSALDFETEDVPLHPAVEPGFTLETDIESEPELAPLGIEEPLVLEQADPAEFTQDLLVIDRISFDEPEPVPEPRERQSLPAAPQDDRPFKLLDDTPRPGDSSPDFNAGQIAESLLMGDEEEHFEFPRNSGPQQPAPELVLPGFRFADDDSDSAPPKDVFAGMKKPDLALTPAEQTEEEGHDPIAFSNEETQTAIPGLLGSETTLGSLMGQETTNHQASAGEEDSDFQAFRPGETVTIHMDAGDGEPEEIAEQTIVSALPAEVEEEKKTVDALDSSSDVFEREYRQGLKDMEGRNWIGAIHHLSIAAALRPGAFDVKDKLREARRMRAKEVEGRA